MAREMALPKDLVNQMIDTFTMVCFMLEDHRIADIDDILLMELTIRGCVEDADYATFRQYGYRIRDIFTDQPE